MKILHVINKRKFDLIKIELSKKADLLYVINELSKKANHFILNKNHVKIGNLYLY